MKEILSDLASRLHRIEVEVDRTLSTIESARSRVMTLDQTRKRLKKLTISQESLIEQAVRCIEAGCFRAAIVTAWVALTDYLHQRIALDKFQHLKRARPSWKLGNLDELRDNYADRLVIDALECTDLLTRSSAKSHRAMLIDRNECAHPSPTEPDRNEAIGYVSKVFRQIEYLETRNF